MNAALLALTVVLGTAADDGPRTALQGRASEAMELTACLTLPKGPLTLSPQLFKDGLRKSLDPESRDTGHRERDIDNWAASLQAETEELAVQTTRGGVAMDFAIQLSEDELREANAFCARPSGHKLLSMLIPSKYFSLLDGVSCALLHTVYAHEAELRVAGFTKLETGFGRKRPTCAP